MSDSSEKSKEESKRKSISSYISELKNITSLLTELFGDKEDLGIEEDEELDFIIRPSSKEVAKEAYYKLIEEVGDADSLTFENPQSVLLESERQFSLIRDDIVSELDDIKEKEEGSVSGADVDTMLYIIDKNGGKTGQFTLIGGAESLIYNTGRKYDWHPYETELVLIANKIAAEKNDLHRHLLLDTVLIIPNDERIVYSSFQ